jgi:hypothetical protein
MLVSDVKIFQTHVKFKFEVGSVSYVKIVMIKTSISMYIYM